jgi:hypothetical protein
MIDGRDVHAQGRAQTHTYGQTNSSNATHVVVVRMSVGWWDGWSKRMEEEKNSAHAAFNVNDEKQRQARSHALVRSWVGDTTGLVGRREWRWRT